jgi:ACDE family multidrug resistance protein
LEQTNIHNENKVAFSALVFATVVFAINTFDIISIFYLIAAEFSQDVSLLGLISATLVLGIGLLQIPSGIMAAKYGPRNSAIVGMLVIMISSVFVGVSTDIYQIAILRFILGGGLALFFPSAIVLSAQNFRKGSEALAVGVIAGSNAAGGVLGLVGWALLVDVIGWRSSIIIGGVLAAVAAAVLYLLLPRRIKTITTTIKQKSFSIQASHIRSLLADKSLIILGIILLGSQATFEQSLAFTPFYLQESLHVEPVAAGLIGSLVLLTALAGSPTIGWLYDRNHNLSTLVLMLACGLLAGTSINYLGVLPSAIASTLIVGFIGGGLFTLLSNAARERVATATGKHKLEYTTLSVNWVHAIALTGTFWAPILSSSSALQYGYQIAWHIIGALSFALIVGFVIIGLRSK